MLEYPAEHTTGLRPTERPLSLFPVRTLPDPERTGTAMHRDDVLAEHRARREASALRALERQAANLAARVEPGERIVLHILCDEARKGEAVTADDVAPFIRARISQLDRDSQRAA